jgi:DeoR family suf operon transcriptional repressor
LHGLHEKQKKILDYLLERTDGATLNDLALHLGVTNTAAKEHLLKIENLGLLIFKDRSGSVGRPRRFYFLSEAGAESFPRQYSWLSSLLLEFISRTSGPSKTAAMMEQLAERVESSMSLRFQKTSSISDRLSEITKALNELGYRAQLKQSDLRKGAIIEATNCVYHTVAKSYPELCNFDINFIKSASGGLAVKLESCIAKGGKVCRFCINKP